MSMKTNDLAELKSFIFNKGNIHDLEDLKYHENYANLDYVNFFESIDKVISAAKEEDKAYFTKLKETMEYCRDYTDAAATLEKLENEKRTLSRKQDECSDIKSRNTVKSVYVFRINHRTIARKTAYDSPKSAMIAVCVYSLILAALALLIVFAGNASITLLPVLMFLIAIYWLVGFIESASKLGPYEDACDEEIELFKKCGELAPKIQEADEKVTYLKREAYMCYRDLNKSGIV